LYPAVGIALTVAYFLVPGISLPALIYTSIGFLATVAVIVGGRANRGGPGWFLFAGTLFLWTLGDAMWSFYEPVTGRPMGYPSVADLLYLIGYPFAFAGIAIYVRDRVGRPRTGIWLDAAIVGSLLGLAAWTIAAEPYLASAGLDVTTDLVGTTYILADVVLVAGLAALMALPRATSASNIALMFALAATLVADAFYNVGLLEGTYEAGIWYEALYLLAYVSWGTAALLPSSAAASYAADVPVAPARRHLRMILVADALLVASLVYQIATGHEVPLLPLVVVGSLAFALTVVRLEGMVKALAIEVSRSRAREADIRRADERFRRAVDSTIFGLIIATPQAEILSVNRTISRMLGYEGDELVGRNVAEIAHPDDRRMVGDLARAFLAGEAEMTTFESRYLKKDGGSIHARVSLAPLQDESGRVDIVVGQILDITETKKLEERVRETEKLEAVGQLASGVAHDFNNLLSVIQNYTYFVRDTLEEGDERRDDLQEVLAAGERGADLVRQLLTFSRRDRARLGAVEFDTTIEEISKLLRRTIRESIGIRLELAAGDAVIELDRTQLEQVVLNLALNAQDAMPQGGTLTIATAAVDVAPDEAVSNGIRPGDFVKIEVRDTGSGIPEPVRDRIFEPFFTTKERGSGTGLGLASVYGAVTRAGGAVSVDTEVGRGTSFQILWPRAQATLSTKGLERVDAPGPQGASILVAEDEPEIRNIVKRILERSGYEVRLSESSLDALSILQQGGARFDLLLTDAVMPGMSGQELAARAVELEPRIRCLFMSGYAEEMEAQHELDGAGFLQKPFTSDRLLEAVESTLRT
jgi:PAS domain S-box-containing protein